MADQCLEMSTLTGANFSSLDACCYTERLSPCKQVKEFDRAILQKMDPESRQTFELFLEKSALLNNFSVPQIKSALIQATELLSPKNKNILLAALIGVYYREDSNDRHNSISPELWRG